MARAVHHTNGFDLSGALRAARALLARLVIGVMLVLAAGIVAVMTAIAGVLLGATALVMRFAGGHRARPRRERAGDEPVTLEARRTPRGWTVE